MPKRYLPASIGLNDRLQQIDFPYTDGMHPDAVSNLGAPRHEPKKLMQPPSTIFPLNDPPYHPWGSNQKKKVQEITQPMHAKSLMLLRSER